MSSSLVRRIPLAVASLSFLALGVFAVQLWRASTAHRRAGLETLNDFASVALDRYASSSESLIRTTGIPLLYPVDSPDSVVASRMADLHDIVQITRDRHHDPCHCLPVAAGDLYFASDRDPPLRDITVDSAGRVVPPPPWLPSVIARLDTLTALNRRIVLFAPAQVPGHPFVLAAARPARGRQPRTIYGVVVPHGSMAQEVFERAFNTTRLVPRLLTPEVSNAEYLTLSVTTPSGDSVFGSSIAHPRLHGDSLVLDAARGGLKYSAVLNPAFVDRLIVGGLPRLPTVQIALLLLLGLGALGGMGWITLRSVDLVRLRTDFTSSVTHELRTPLTLIRLSAETLLLGRARSPSEQNASLEAIIAEARRMEQLVDNVLHFSRAERKVLQVQPADIQVDQFLDEAMQGFLPLVAERAVSLRRLGPSGLAVRADPAALRVVLFNLLDNAARYGPAGGVIELETARSASNVTFAVSDDGPGIPAGDRERVWKPFERLAATASQNVPGSGLGLAVVRELVTAMGGSCRIAPTPEGCRVEVLLPAVS